MVAIKNTLRDLTPPLLWRAMKRINSKTNISYHCPVCGKKVKEFLRKSDYHDDMLEKYEHVHSIFCEETMNRKAYACPHCKTNDRNRLYAIYLNKRFQTLTNKEYTFLDIAPTKGLSEFIKKCKLIRYRSADLFMEGVDDKVDITDMNIYKDNSFDIILCSNVLEHIDNDRKAMSELFRILKPSGFGIVMVPINLCLKEDFENPEYKTEAERWKYYGQNDHVRYYSKDGFVNKLNQTGFKVSQLGIDFFGAEVFEKNGIHPRSILYVVEK